MSQPDLSSADPPGVLRSKPKTSIYTMLLLLALLALLLGCLFLYLEINQYGGFGAVKGKVSSLISPLTCAVESLV